METYASKIIFNSRIHNARNTSIVDAVVIANGHRWKWYIINWKYGAFDHRGQCAVLKTLLTQ